MILPRQTDATATKTPEMDFDAAADVKDENEADLQREESSLFSEMKAISTLQRIQAVVVKFCEKARVISGVQMERGQGGVAACPHRRGRDRCAPSGHTGEGEAVRRSTPPFLSFVVCVEGGALQWGLYSFGPCRGLYLYKPLVEAVEPNPGWTT